jgi:hypothetical protein
VAPTTSLHANLPRNEEPQNPGDRCTFITQRGSQCRRLATEGERVCVLHGGDLKNAAESTQRRLLGLTEVALNAIEEVLATGDPRVLSDTAFKLLAISGYGPSSTLKLETGETDLTKLSDEQLAARIETVRNKAIALAKQRMEQTPSTDGETEPTSDASDIH